MVSIIPVLNYVRTVFEHTGSPGTHRLRLGRLARFVFGPHHVLESHAWPSVPSYNLPATRSFDRDTPILSLSELMTFLERP